MRTAINLFPDTIRDSLQAEAITKEVPVNQVFDFSYLPPRWLHQKKVRWNQIYRSYSKLADSVY